MNENKVTVSDIIREPILGYVLIKHTTKFGKIIFKEPIIGWWEVPESDGIELEGDDEIIGIIQAPPGSYLVFGTSETRNTPIQLGTEFPGASHPDWIVELEERRKVEP